MKNQNVQKESETQFPVGCLAQSLAGHDKGEYFIILSEDGAFVTLADGRLRTTEKPKKKKKKHIQIKNQPLITEFPVRDEEIRKVLKDYMKNHCGI